MRLADSPGEPTVISYELLVWRRRAADTRRSDRTPHRGWVPAVEPDHVRRVEQDAHAAGPSIKARWGRIVCKRGGSNSRSARGALQSLVYLQ